MAKTVSYEIHSYRDGNWTIVGVQDNKAEAIHQARQLLTSKTQHGVKVIEEKYDDESDRTTSAVVFTETKGADKKPTAEVNAEVKKKKKKERVTSAKPKKKKQKGGFLRYLIILVLSVGGIALAVIAIGGFLLGAFG